MHLCGRHPQLALPSCPRSRAHHDHEYRLGAAIMVCAAGIARGMVAWGKKRLSRGDEGNFFRSRARTVPAGACGRHRIVLRPRADLGFSNDFDARARAPAAVEQNDRASGQQHFYSAGDSIYSLQRNGFGTSGLHWRHAGIFQKRNFAGARVAILLAMVRRQFNSRHRLGFDRNHHNLRRRQAGAQEMKLDLYTRLYFWLIAHRRVVLCVTLLIAAAAIVISTRVNLEEDILATLPQHDKIVDEYRYTLRKFRQIDRVYIDVGINANDPDKLTATADEVFSQLSANTNYARIVYRFEMTGQQKVIQFLTGALPNLFTESDAQALAPKLETNSVRQYLTVMRRKLGGMEGMVLKDVVAADPIGMSTLVVNKVLPLQTGFGDGQIVDGRITSGDGKHILLMAEPKFSSSDSRNSVALVADLLRMRDDVEKQFPGVHIAITGGHRMAVDNASLIKGAATRCIFLGMASMLFLCVTAYRRKWLAVVTFLPSLFGTLIAGAVLMLWDNHLSAIAVGFATIAIGITVDYGIYVVYHPDNAARDRKSAAQIVRRLLPPMAIGVMTIIAAFIVLATSPMHGYQQLGIFGAVGVLVSAAFALLILPLLIPLPKNNNLPPLRFTNWMENFHAWTKRWRPLLLIGVIVLTIVTAFGVKRLRFEGDIAKMNGVTKSTRDDEVLIRKTWGDALGLTLVVARGTNVEETLEQNDRAAEVLAHDPNVTEVYSLASICPSAATQEANIKRWQKFWTSTRQNALHQTLQQV